MHIFIAACAPITIMYIRLCKILKSEARFEARNLWNVLLRCVYVSTILLLIWNIYLVNIVIWVSFFFRFCFLFLFKIRNKFFVVSHAFYDLHWRDSSEQQLSNVNCFKRKLSERPIYRLACVDCSIYLFKYETNENPTAFGEKNKKKM